MFFVEHFYQILRASKMDYEELLMTKCKICEGHKYIYGMGNIREKCKDCEGKGFISKAAQTAKEVAKQKKDKDKKDGK